MAKNKLQDKISNLPLSPGVYLFKNSRERVIYVGKAARLRQRVRQYFQASRSADAKTDALVREIRDIEHIETESEMDALFLEAELIRRYMPRYNILLRDDKSLLYVRIDTTKTYPDVSFTRRPLDDGAAYFGPFQSGFSVKRALKYLRRVWPYSTHAVLPKRVCLQYHLGLCPGPEEGKISPEDYHHNIQKLTLYLKGRRVQLLKQIEKEMKLAAKDQQFEEAASLRNQLTALKSLRQQVVFGDREFLDISKDEGLAGLQKLLNLPAPPRRIEGYDISHMGGQQNTASMVVFTLGLPDKGQYRKFNLKTPGNDDFAHMREVISRRFSGRHPNWPLPDLILIDGGKGQLSSAMMALKEADQQLPVIGLAKRQETIIVPVNSGFESVSLAKQDPIILLLQRIRDESHRFALSYHTTLKRKAQTASELEDIPGIGPATRKKLIRTFGSTRGVMQARQWELDKTIGPKKAKILRQYLRPRRK